MLNIGSESSKYVKVWEVEDKGNYVKATVSSSKKNQEGEYENSNWFPAFVGKAKNKAKDLVKGSTIEITQGGISNVYDKEKKVTYYNVVIFDYELIGTQPEGSTSTAPADDDFSEDDVPF